MDSCLSIIYTDFQVSNLKIISKNTLKAGFPILVQIFRFIPQDLLCKAVEECKSDAYYKTLTTQKQLIAILYGVITKCHSFNGLCKNLQFLENKLSCIGMPELPPRSTLSDGNINRDSIVFEKLYGLLYEHYTPIIGNEASCFFKDADGIKKIEIIDSSTITLFTELFKGAGRNCLNGAKKED